jgi:hypothetical protein
LNISRQLEGTTELSDKKIRALTRSFIAQQTVIFTRQQEGRSVEYIEAARRNNGTYFRSPEASF